MFTLSQANLDVYGVAGAINTATGANAAAGGDATDTLSGDTLDSLASGGLSISASAVGGEGGLDEGPGLVGIDGTQGVYVSTFEEVGYVAGYYTPGGDGEDGGVGGAGGNGSFDFADNTLGEADAPYQGTFDLQLSATGGQGTFGQSGGGGGSAGMTQLVMGSDSYTMAIYGGLGGSGGDGGPGGVGGAGSDTVNSLTAATLGGIELVLQGTGAAGGAGGQSGDAGYGGVGGDSGNGGAGGSGGVGLAVLSSSALTSSVNLALTLDSTGGAGGEGGADGSSNASLESYSSSTTSYAISDYAADGNSGAGGQGGGATAELLSDALGGAAVTVSMAVQAGDGGAAGAQNDYNGEPAGVPGVGGQGGDAMAELQSDTISASALTVTMSALAGNGGAAAAQIIYNGFPGVPGAGGQGGDATAELLSDTFTASAITVTMNVHAGDGGAAGAQTFYNGEPPGVTGAAGADGADLIEITGSSFTLQAPANGAASVLTLDLGAAGEALDGGAGGNLVFSGDTFTGDGASTLDLDVAGGGVFVDMVAGEISIGGSTANAITGFQDVTLDSNDTIVTASGVNTTLSGDPDTVIVEAGHVGGTIYDADSSNFVLDFEGFPGLTLDQLQADTAVVNGDTLVTVDGQTLTLENYSGGLSEANTDIIPCFLQGTRVATARGDIAVEDLRAGDLALTTEGVFKPICWIGRRAVKARFSAPLRAWPIRVRAGALGANTPCRDLLLSPDHALFLEGVLAHAGALVNGASITRETRVPEIFVYFHVELEDHDLIRAEGAAAETFVDNADRMAFDNWAEYEALYPEGRSVAELPLPRAKSRRQVPASIRVLLDAQADKLGLCGATAA